MESVQWISPLHCYKKGNGKMIVKIAKRIEGTAQSETVAEISMDMEWDLKSFCFYNTFLGESERTKVFANLTVQTVLVGYNEITILCEEKINVQ